MVTLSDGVGFYFWGMPCFIQLLSWMSTLPLYDPCTFKRHSPGMAPFLWYGVWFASLSTVLVLASVAFSPDCGCNLLSPLPASFLRAFWSLSLQQSSLCKMQIMSCNCCSCPFSRCLLEERQNSFRVPPFVFGPSWCWPPSCSLYSSTPAPSPVVRKATTAPKARQSP